jgi:hypothetical protein
VNNSGVGSSGAGGASGIPTRGGGSEGVAVGQSSYGGQLTIQGAGGTTKCDKSSVDCRRSTPRSPLMCHEKCTDYDSAGNAIRTYWKSNGSTCSEGNKCTAPEATPAPVPG